MVKCIKILYFVLLTWSYVSAVPCTPKVAIIGGGIGGASAAHFLTELFDGKVQIDLFESDHLGGRLANIKIGEDEYEAGGAVIHGRNWYMNYFMDTCQLKKAFNYVNPQFGIWNGQRLIFKENKQEYLTNLKMFIQYGKGPIKVERYANKVLQDFQNIYLLQDAGRTFDNVTSLLSAMNPKFPDLLKQPLKEHLERRGISRKLIDEVVKVATVANYAQDTNIHAFVGYVALIGIQPNIYSIFKGNKMLPKKIIQYNHKVNVIFGRVTKIRLFLTHLNVHEYLLFFIKEGTKYRQTKMYDVVIIATPLTADQKHVIKFEGFPDPSKLIFPGQYQTTVASFIKGELNRTYFKNHEIETIVSIKPNETNFDYIGKESPAKASMNYFLNRNKPHFEHVWKVFTRDYMSNEQWRQLFSKVREGKSRIWKAYPMYDPKEKRLDRFKLHEGLYHVNAIEWAASAMEMSAIGARNVALLAHRYFKALGKGSCPV